MVVTTAILWAAACVASAVLTLILWKAAPRFGLVDHPDGRHKTHRRPTSLGGGLAIYAATAGLVAAALVVPSPFRAPLRGNWPGLVALLVAGAVAVTLGLVDDRVRLRGRQKLVGQILVASIVVAGGLMIRQIDVFGWHIVLGPLSLPFTLFWLLGGINSLNLLDGIDGLATMLGFILVSAVGVIALLTGRLEIAVIALVFAGSLLGFAPFNLPPAKVFLGDAGSMLVGLVVATLAIQGSLKTHGTVLLAAPLAIWTIPIFDSAAAILRRTLTGQSIYATDRSHLHHRLLERLGSHYRVLAWVAVTCALTSAAALVSVVLKNDLVAVVTCLAVVGMFILTGLFGRAEFLLLASRLRSGLASLLPRSLRGTGRTPQSAHRIQGSGHWERLWETITASAENLELARVRLDINIPAAGERFNAVWGHDDGEGGDDGEGDRRWEIEMPLVVANQYVGHLTLTAYQNGRPPRHDVDQLFVLFEDVETQLTGLLDDGHLVPATVPATVPADLAPETGTETGFDSGTSELSRKHPK